MSQFLVFVYVSVMPEISVSNFHSSTSEVVPRLLRLRGSVTLCRCQVPPGRVSVFIVRPLTSISFGKWAVLVSRNAASLITESLCISLT